MPTHPENLLSAGHELDAVVAARVMGCPREWDWHSYVVAGDKTQMPHPEYQGKAYSTDISAAWEVVEKMGYRPFNLFTSLVQTGPIEHDKIPCRWEWYCYFDDAAHPSLAETAPLAICRAALRAMEHVNADAS